MDANVKTRGFTIIEILVVIILISILAALIVPRYLERAEQAKRLATKASIARIEQHLGAFYTDCSRYPTPSEGLSALRSAPPGLGDKWKGPYGGESDLIDPWGNQYVYQKPGKKNPNRYDIISYGADGQPGGEGDNADITND